MKEEKKPHARVKSIMYIIHKLIWLVGCVSIVLCADKLYSAYNLKIITRNQTSQYGKIINNFDQWIVAHKSTIYRPVFIYRDRDGININSISLDSSKGNIQAQFFISIYGLLYSFTRDDKNNNQYNEKIDHYTDHFLSVYYPYEFSFFDERPSLYYSIDGEEPIFARIRSFEVENSILKIYFRTNVYDFFRKCSQGKNIAFFVNDFQNGIITKEFSLKGFKQAYEFGFKELQKIEKDRLSTS